MMDESNIDDFEQFLRNQADKNRMYPNDQIWRNINQQLHGNRRWPALTFAAILTGAILTAGTIFLHPSKQLFKVQPPLATTIATTSSPVPSSLIEPQTNGRLAGSLIKPMDAKKAIYSFNYQAPDANNAQEADLAGSGNNIVLETVVPSDNSVTDLSFQSGVAANSKAVERQGQVSNTLKPANSQAIVVYQDTDATINNNGELKAEAEAAEANAEKDETKTFGEARHSQDVVPGLPSGKSAKKLSLQVYGGSNISYRILSEPASLDYHFPYNSAISSNPRLNVNDFVKQQSAVGFELGAAVHYPLNDKITIKAGLQFNYRQYNINAFSSLQQSSVLLMNSNTGTDSVRVYSAIGNSTGYSPLSLKNKYFQVGIPVGLSWTIAEGKKASFSLGGTVEPTFQLNSNIYMITSDYKSYTQQPDMVRKLNFNGAVEALVTFKTKGLAWQVGPQVRYQMLPTQVKTYSVHEHLIDYGIKFGVVKQLK